MRARTLDLATELQENRPGLFERVPKKGVVIIPSTKRITNRTKNHRARGTRGKKNYKSVIAQGLGTEVAASVVKTLLLSGDAASAKKLVMELNKR